MSFIRRILLNQQKEKKPLPSGYIQDDLMLYLDCRDAKPSADGNNWQWVDTISGILFDMHNVYQQSDKGVIFSGDVTCYGLFEKDTSINSSISTLEVCYIENSLTTRGGPFIQYNQRHQSRLAGFGTYFMPNFDIWASGQSYPKYNRGSIGKHTLSFNKNICFNNKINIEAKGTDYFNGNEHVGTRLGNNFNGVIYSIRVYNRLLTEEEMLHNQQVDIDTFFGGNLPKI